MRCSLMCWSVLICLAMVGTSAHAQVYHGEEMDVELIAESQHVVPGGTLWTAIRLDPSDGWHTYSKWPGDSGDATMIHRWDLPESAQAGDIQWPVPHWLPFPGTDLVTFSYKEEVLLMVPIQVPANFQGAEFPMTAHVEWQVCDLICLIGEAEVSLTLPVAGRDVRAESKWANAFAATRDTLPMQDHSIEALFALDGDRVSFSFVSDDQRFASAQDAWFFPEQRRVLRPGPLRDVVLYPAAVQVVHEQPRRMQQDLQQVRGLLAVQGSNGTVRAYEITAGPSSANAQAAVIAAAGQPGSGSEAGSGQRMLMIVMFALVGGLILNLMPCVFPVLSLKVLNLTSKSGASNLQYRLHGLAYTAGIVAAFMVLASVLLALRASGQAVGWAFQLQSPWFVASLVILFFMMGLSLSGVYELGTRFMGVGSSLVETKGYKSSFFTGVLATVVASPCTAPFMGAALGFALSQSWLAAMVVFAALGVGMALPFLILSFSPRLMKYMPGPGQWMVTFKEFMAFPMYATALWLLWVFGLQTGLNAMIALASAALLVALALWLLQKGRQGAGSWSGAN